MDALEMGISLIFESTIKDLEAILIKYKQGGVNNDSRRQG